MTRLRVLPVSLPLVLAFTFAACGGPEREEPPGSGGEAASSAQYEPIPDGYHYMMDSPALERAVREGDRSVVRRHGWYLWAGIMQPARSLPDWPIWATWPNTFDAFSTVGMPIAEAQRPLGRSMRAANAANTPIDTRAPRYDIPDSVLARYRAGICKTHAGEPTVCDGAHFLFNGDIMIPTESLSRQGMSWISENGLYLRDTLDAMHRRGRHLLEAPPEYVVTKHMYWPVKQSGLSTIPVWRDDFGPEFTGYAGYEMWSTLVAVDPSGQRVGEMARVTYLYGVRDAEGGPLGPITEDARVFSLDDFYHHRVSATDWDRFDVADKAVLNAASYWAYDRPFGPGDYLVTVAMHINTREIPSWALQSVWWSDRPDAGQYAADRPEIPAAQGPWRHYLLVDSYGIPLRDGSLPVAMNPYIELAIHPVATNCQNCHLRAGWPTGDSAGQASYQNPDCPSALEHLTPDSGCLRELLLTDFQWIVPDRAH